MSGRQKDYSFNKPNVLRILDLIEPDQALLWASSYWIIKNKLSDKTFVKLMYQAIDYDNNKPDRRNYKHFWLYKIFKNHMLKYIRSNVNRQLESLKKKDL